MLKNIICFIVLTILFFSIFESIAPTVILILLCLFLWMSYFSVNYNVTNKKIKKMIFVVFFIGVFSDLYAGLLPVSIYNVNNFHYQASLFISLICLFSSALLCFVVLFKIKFNTLNHGSNNDDNDINPATGLPMQDGIDSAGNVFGQNTSDINK